MPNRVEAHIKMCYLSMCLLSLIKYNCAKLNLSASEIMEEWSTIYKVNLKHLETKVEFEKIVTQSNIQKQILKKIKV